MKKILASAVLAVSLLTSTVSFAAQCSTSTCYHDKIHLEQANVEAAKASGDKNALRNAHARLRTAKYGLSEYITEAHKAGFTVAGYNAENEGHDAGEDQVYPSQD